MSTFVKAKRTGPNAQLAFGFVRTGLVHDIPSDALDAGWEPVGGGQKKRVTEPASGPGSRDFASLTVRELKEHLDAAGVEHPASANKAELVSLLEAHHGD